MSAFPRRTITLLFVGLFAAGPMPASAQSTQSLAALTVPVERLPVGCRLEPVDTNATGAARFVMSPGVHENPWVGTEARHFGSMRREIDGPAGPTYGLPSGPALYARLAEDVVEVYRARYLSADHQVIEVYAVRFADPALTRAASMSALIADPSQDRRPRIVRGSIAALVFQYQASGRQAGTVRAPSDTCLRAVSDHIAALK